MTIEAMKLALGALETVVADVTTTPNAYETQRQAIAALRTAIDHAERPMTHTDNCWKWHHQCAIAKIEQREKVQVRPEQFVKLIKDRETLRGHPLYWAEWPMRK